MTMGEARILWSVDHRVVLATELTLPIQHLSSMSVTGPYYFTSCVLTVKNSFFQIFTGGDDQAATLQHITIDTTNGCAELIASCKIEIVVCLLKKSARSTFEALVTING
jgi:hypothetical protein